jgi:hypothetical protein
LDQKNSFKNILEKVIFYILSRFFLRVLCPKKKKFTLQDLNFFFLEIGRSHWVSKIDNFMLISKSLICLSDKMLPKKVKLKNCLKVQIGPSSNPFVF